MNDRRGEDPVLIEEVAANLSLIQSLNLHVRDGAHLARLERSVEANLWDRFQFVHPISRQKPQPCFFPFAADAVVKQD